MHCSMNQDRDELNSRDAIKLMQSMIATSREVRASVLEILLINAIVRIN